MSNQRYTQFRYAKEKKVVDLFAKVTFGSTGAPTLVVAQSKGVKSITRNSAGDYTITLGDKYTTLLGVRHIFQNATAPASPASYIKSATASTVELVFNAAGTATDPASGEAVLLQFIFNDTTAF
jgi:hypothetical protein